VDPDGIPVDGPAADAGVAVVDHERGGRPHPPPRHPRAPAYETVRTRYKTVKASIWAHIRESKTHIRQAKPDSGLCFKRKDVKTVQVVPLSLVDDECGGRPHPPPRHPRAPAYIRQSKPDYKTVNALYKTVKAHVRQSKSDSGLGVKGTVRKTVQGVPISLGSGRRATTSATTPPACTCFGECGTCKTVKAI